MKAKGICYKRTVGGLPYFLILNTVLVNRVEHELQTTKTAVSLQDFTLHIRRRPTLFFELEDGTDSGNVIL